jgi:hypothetical protein
VISIKPRFLADMPHTPMDARTPMIFVQKVSSIESLESPWVEEKDPKGQLSRHYINMTDVYLTFLVT